MQQVGHSFSEKIVIGYQMTVTTSQKIAYGATLAATILGGAGIGTVIAGSTLAITAGGVLGATVGLIGIIFHRTLIAGQAEEILQQIKNNSNSLATKKQLYDQTKKLADQGYRDAEFYAGCLACSFTSPDQSRIFKWYKLAADKGHKVAQFEVGNRYKDGIGVKADRDDAMKYYKLAADQGISLAMYYIGAIYETND